MNKEFVPYEIALTLKELGFDETCFTYYKNDQLSDILELVKNSQMKNVNNEVDDYISAPTFSQAFRWFRENYNLPSHIHTIWQYDWNNYSYQWHITEDKEEWNCIEYFKTYEEAELACLNKLIELVKNK